jgi:hypothetical protein
MKTFLFVIATLLCVSSAHADPLSEIYLGKWCGVGKGNYMAASDEEWKECVPQRYFEIRRDGYSAPQQECKFVSIKHGKKFAPWTKAKLEEYVPVLHIIARCEWEGEKSIDKFSMVYSKGILYLGKFNESNPVH